MRKAAPLHAGLMNLSTAATKGQAMPVRPEGAEVNQPHPSASVAVDFVPRDPVSELTTVRLLPTKSMTVKVDVVSYDKLKSHGLSIGKTSQDIFIEALTMYFKVKNI